MFKGQKKKHIRYPPKPRNLTKFIIGRDVARDF